MEKASGATALYGYRPVLNAEEIHAWAAEQGIKSILAPDDMHVTVVFSRRAFSVDYTDLARGKESDVWHRGSIPVKDGQRSIMPLGDKGAVVLKLESDDLQSEWSYFTDMGASWDWDAFQPHVTLTYKGDFLDGVTPYMGPVILGPLTFRMLKLDGAADDHEETAPVVSDMIARRNDMAKAKIIKTDEEQRIVWGWASVSTVNGAPITDSQGDQISPETMSKAADRFMQDVRTAKAMHTGNQIGEVIHSLPLTKELGDALGVSSAIEGWIVAMKIHSDEVWEKVKSGEFRAFSIGGRGVRNAI